MLCRGESLGVFQVESRAQMNMLPRLKPRQFYDLVIEVAIVRPGPIQGDMVHPYLRRRNGHREGRAIRRRRRSMATRTNCAGAAARPWACRCSRNRRCGSPSRPRNSRPSEANGLRRAMATFRNVGTIGKFEEKMVGNMIARGYAPEFAKNCFKQIKGFGDYGFPESHAASFAQLVYVSSWLKHFHPEAFCLRAAEFAADGLLRAGADRRRRPQATASRCARSTCPSAMAQNTLEERCGQISRACGSAFARSTASWASAISDSDPGRRTVRSWTNDDWGRAHRRRAHAPALHLAGGFRPRHRACPSAR